LEVADTIIYRIIQERQPDVVEELRRRQLSRWAPGGEIEDTVTLNGRAYRDVTDRATEEPDGVGVPPGHDAYRREHGRVRQVRRA
jgi:hypothetical protein